MMVYSGETPDMSTPSKDVATRTAQGVKVLGAGVVKVLHSCKDAKESQTLDLNTSSLIQVPDAVYSLMRTAHILHCNLSGNLITKISPRLGACFRHITTLNLSSNRLSL